MGQEKGSGVGYKDKELWDRGMEKGCPPDRRVNKNEHLKRFSYRWRKTIGGKERYW